MRRIIGPILALFGILAVIGVATGVAYSAGFNAASTLTAATTVTATGTTTVVPVVGYGWFGGPWIGFGFGQFLFMLIGFFVIVALLRVVFGGGRHHGHGHGWGSGYGWGHGYGPGGRDRRGPDGRPAGPDGSGDPREAWIRGRLDDWHRTAHAGGPASGPATPATDGPTEPPAG